jgi:hypothetical protein
MFCNANPARGHYQEFSALQLVCIFRKYGGEVFDLGLQARTWHPEEYNTLMGELHTGALTAPYAGLLL